jgi:DNA-binding beta-propeller fold protein YncE
MAATRKRLRQVEDTVELKGKLAFQLGSGKSGTELGELVHPQGIAFNPVADEIYVSGLGDQIMVYSSSGKPVRSVAGVSRSIAFSLEEHKIFLADAPGHRINVLPIHAPHEAMQTISNHGSEPGELSYPMAVVVAGDELVVADTANHRVSVFTIEGEFKRSFGTSGSGPGQLNWPVNLAVLGNEVWVADTANNRLSVFALQDGSFLRHVGRVGSGPGQFTVPHSICVVSEKHSILAVTDALNCRVQFIKSDGKYVGQLGLTGIKEAAPGQFIYPTAVTMTNQGLLLVCDADCHRVQAFRLRSLCALALLTALHRRAGSTSSLGKAAVRSSIFDRQVLRLPLLLAGIPLHFKADEVTPSKPAKLAKKAAS